MYETRSKTRGSRSNVSHILHVLTRQTGRDAHHYMALKNSPGQGRGLFAKVNIRRGTRILSENRLLAISDSDEQDISDVTKAIENLPPDKKSFYMSLHPYISPTAKPIFGEILGKRWSEISTQHQKIIAIWSANNYGNVYELGSFFNHSCVPNICYSFNSRIDKMTFHAIRDINAGEELKSMYNLGTFRTRAQRRAELKHWGFVCQCEACQDTPEGEAREKQRRKLNRLDQTLAQLNATPNLSEADYRKGLSTAKDMISILLTEGWTQRDLETW